MGASDCIFCRIVAGEIPSTKVAEDDLVVAIRDVNPVAPTHILVMPRAHIAGTRELTEEDGELLARSYAMLRRLARDEGIAEDGYRIVTNDGPAGGQTVPHLHFHLLGGRRFTWPPG
jgi:histidine triad (HIT) family protein